MSALLLFSLFICFSLLFCLAFKKCLQLMAGLVSSSSSYFFVCSACWRFEAANQAYLSESLCWLCGRVTTTIVHILYIHYIQQLCVCVCVCRCWCWCWYVDVPNEFPATLVNGMRYVKNAS